MNLPLCIVLLYVVLLFAVSFYVSHKQRNNKESLLLYKGQNNTLIVAASVAGLAIGGASTIGISENAFAAGLSAGWYDTAWAIGAVIAGLFVVDRLRRGNYDTISDLIGDLYGSRTRILMVITMCLIQSGIIALQYKAGGSILAALLPKVFTVQSGTFFSFVIFVLVAAIGGMGSVTLKSVPHSAAWPRSSFTGKRPLFQQAWCWTENTENRVYVRAFRSCWEKTEWRRSSSMIFRKRRETSSTSAVMPSGTI